ncbi:hypothetical protein Dimus_005695 [Dionaea muscipula]
MGAMEGLSATWVVEMPMDVVVAAGARGRYFAGRRCLPSAGESAALLVVSASLVSGSLPGSATEHGSCPVAIATPGGEGRAAAFDDDGVALGRKLEDLNVNMGLGSSHGPLMEEADDSHGQGSGLPHGLHGSAKPLHGKSVGGLGVLHQDSVHGGPGFVLPESVGVHGYGTSFSAVLRGWSSGLGGGCDGQSGDLRDGQGGLAYDRFSRGAFVLWSCACPGGGC